MTDPSWRVLTELALTPETDDDAPMLAELAEVMAGLSRPAAVLERLKAALVEALRQANNVRSALTSAWISSGVV